MATFIGQIKIRQIIMIARVSSSRTAGLQSLMDTGAQVTMISR